jgi:hypothetical protein
LKYYQFWTYSNMLTHRWDGAGRGGNTVKKSGFSRNWSWHR